MVDIPLIWYWCNFIAHWETRGSCKSIYFFSSMDPCKSPHRNFNILMHSFSSLVKPPYSLWFKSKMFVALINCIRISSDHMVDKPFILYTRKGGRAMNFLITDYPLLFCVKFRTSEGEDSFFRFSNLAD